MPEWLTSIELRNESGGVMSNWTVYFEQIDGDASFNLDTDANGTIVEYLPEGEWLVYVDEFIVDDGDDSNITSTTVPRNIDRRFDYSRYNHTMANHRGRTIQCDTS